VDEHSNLARYYVTDNTELSVSGDWQSGIRFTRKPGSSSVAPNVPKGMTTSMTDLQKAHAVFFETRASTFLQFTLDTSISLYSGSYRGFAIAGRSNLIGINNCPPAAPRMPDPSPAAPPPPSPPTVPPPAYPPLSETECPTGMIPWTVGYQCSSGRAWTHRLGGLHIAQECIDDGPGGECDKDNPQFDRNFWKRVGVLQDGTWMDMSLRMADGSVNTYGQTTVEPYASWEQPTDQACSRSDIVRVSGGSFQPFGHPVAV
jgi:hypothetical protein